jgi:hypothetical protein
MFIHRNKENTFIIHLFHFNYEQLKILQRNKTVIEMKSIMQYKIHEVLKLFSTLSTKADAEARESLKSA